MNATNRGLNRVVLLVVGATLLGLGGGAAAVAAWSPAGTAWSDWSSAAIAWMRDADRATRLSDSTSVSWFVLAILLLLVVVVAFAAVVLSRLGGGRSSTVIRDERGAGVQGPVTIHQGFAADLITRSLDAHDEILASRVSTRRLRGADVLQVTVTPRQNVSPVSVAETVSPLLDRLDALLGRRTPTLVTIRSGLRSRIAADESRVN
ncbi:hypothetical protein BMH32_00615 [Leucobacter sp. OLJS4]|uniref:hypothetical protein n=1 Tax=unclassified Leucobacter TaxID=2621730 RepID=UPI000C191BDA|nr:MULTISPECIES: hypothetical protein [unclassified Leucobacter]PIJ34526.1 hypothetical protein BMH30_09905 [Leucobacter sp. OLES1]PII83795.1 hypothetical protein BMH25_06740 [Leucobacter sp. OLCALW19]PII89328.1 hypothetical protein BMH26_03780 [Leucobacter sp. OLTLW20]PII90675.1 hypothetical protein BMH27_09980 [Leucobacter sp. OLAS13]PII99610.1 hypothetical protein BMH29_03495 [Leucobacter sp. OLDS2]